MSRFRDELRVIPQPAWVIAWVCYLSIATAIYHFALPTDPKMRFWAVWQKALFAYGIFLFLFAYILLIGYVYGDAKRRGMRYVLWTFLATLVPNAIGILLYFVLRDPLPRPCPACNGHVLGSFAFCPHCGTFMKPACPQCGKPVQHAWSHCAHCGAKLPAIGEAPKT